MISELSYFLKMEFDYNCSNIFVFFLTTKNLYWREGVEKKVAPILGPIQWQLFVP